ncbi:Eco57I restriction-modification methylase domain-containing protein [Candidatus Bipolaricaulota bacterium]|nr:Eco57I restriction-modification methylase domain-containing protein [Candidatus Bipolaricaulota bacterium]
MTFDLTNTLDVVRKSLNCSTCRRQRSDVGQFLTPAKIARFMASLFEHERKNVRILDAGAGTGVLFAACVEAYVSGKRPSLSINVVAYENDQQILPYLKETMERCESTCKRAGISFRGDIRAEDFVVAAIAETEENLFAPQGERFSHAILNPPYKKINSQTATRRLLDAAGIGVSNLYAAFVWLAARMLEPGGELVAITPRSFCNGPYFRRFRLSLLDMMSLSRIHVFESRKKAFGDDDVLQENVIFHAVRGERKPERVRVSSSEGIDFDKSTSRSVPYRHVVLPGDRDAFIRLVANDADDRVMEKMGAFTTSLVKLGVDVSTGRVVDFRAREYLRPLPEDGTAPLIHPCHFDAGFVTWPAESGKKPNAIVASARTRDLLVPTGYYVLTKRFSTKEEPRRVVAAIYDPNKIEAPFVGFENHLNYFHANGMGLSANFAKGLALYLNSSLFDRYFRLFSGHTQVNATDLRKMRYPSRAQLLRLGGRVRQRMPNQEMVDAILEKECEGDG